jgi:hypothetical protein
MPVFLVSLAGLLSQVLAFLAVRVIVAFGLTAVTYVGLAAALLDLKDAFVLAYSGLPANMLALFGVMRIDQGALIIFSAWSARFTLFTIDGSLTKIVAAGAAPSGS